MFRSLLLLLLVLAVPGTARAFGPDGATAPVTSFAGPGLSLAVFGVDTASGGVAEELPLKFRIATAGVTWARHGWSVGIAGGQVQYGIPALFDVTARLAAVSIGRELTQIAGGTLAGEFRASRLFGDEDTTDIFAASLRWSLKF